MPDGSLAVIAALIIHRTQLGQPRSTILEEQPMPLRALGKMAETLMQHQGETVRIEGILRRRYYSRDGEQRWGQVEIWVDKCHPVNNESHQE
ncbi:MAG: hypothetical protein R8K22_05260 [Mariprofundaceae bacterium]